MIKERGNPWLRWVDRWCGIPLIWLLGRWNRKRKCPVEIRSIALLKTAGIGDTVLLTGIIADLKKKFPDALIYLYTGRANQGMADLLPQITCICLPITQIFTCIFACRKRKHDVWIDCDAWPRINALLTFFSRATFTIGFQTKEQHRHFIYDQPIEHQLDNHEIDNFRKLIAAIGVQGTHHPSIQLNTERQANQKVVLHLFPGGSRATLKQWPLSHWHKLVEILLRHNFSLVLTGSATDYTYLVSFLEKFPKVENCAGKLTLYETAVLLSNACCLISVDTGIMHLAAALGTPVIALHGPTSPLRWGAIGKKVIALTPTFSYHPCIHLGFEKHCTQNRCMQEISVDRVFHAFQSIIGNV